MTKIEYIILDDQETYPDDAEELENTLPYTPSQMRAAQRAASQYHDNGGWERNDWPLKFEIYFNGESQGVFDVDREAVPEFTVRKVT